MFEITHCTKNYSLAALFVLLTCLAAPALAGEHGDEAAKKKDSTEMPATEHQSGVTKEAPKGDNGSEQQAEKTGDGKDPSTKHQEKVLDDDEPTKKDKSLDQ